MVAFNNSDSDVLQKIIKILEEESEVIGKENSTEKDPVSFDLTDLDFNTRVDIMRHVLKEKDLVNSYFIMNIFNLIKRDNTLDSSLLSSDKVIINTLSEFVDIKKKLRVEIQEFIDQLSFWYFSIMKSAAKLEYIPQDDIKVLPKVFSQMLLLFDFLTISGIISKCSNIETDNLVLVENAYSYLVELSKKCKISDFFFSELSKVFNQE